MKDFLRCLKEVWLTFFAIVGVIIIMFVIPVVVFLFMCHMFSIGNIFVGILLIILFLIILSFEIALVKYSLEGH